MPVQGGDATSDASRSAELGDREALAAALTAQVESTVFGPVEWVVETGSTNADLLARAGHGAPSGLVRVADHQTAGRGRRDRTWTDVGGQSLLVSVLLRPSMDAGLLSVLTSAFAVATAEACDALGCPGSRIKWPNDLVVGPVDQQRKLAGILAQSQVSAAGTAVVIGLGLNIESAALAPLDNPAAALDELGVPPGRDELLVRILRNADRVLRTLDDDPEAMWDRYRGRSATLGTVVEVELEGRSLTGRAEAVSETGALVVELAEETVEVLAGDVVSVATALDVGG